MTRTALACLAFALAALPALAQEEITLEGRAFLDEEACAKGLQGADCVLTFEVSGKAAKLLYEGMKVKARHEECTGGMEKAENGLHCIMGEDKTYNCDFGYHFKDKEFAGGHLDC